MGRPKLYDDEFLIACVDSFWKTWCRKNPGNFTYKALSGFIAESENAPVSSDTLKHNKAVREKVASLKSNIYPPTESTRADTNDERERLKAEICRLTESNQKLKDFISSTYVHDVCVTLINDELNLQLESRLKNDNACRHIISAGVEPFSSPVIREMAALFNLEGDDDE